MCYNLKFKCTLIFLSLLLLSCEKVEYFEPQEIAINKPIILAHAATGYSTDIGNNTLEGAIYGLNILDGIEVDVAISKDGGLWITHDSKVKSLDKYFINVTDNDIAGITDGNNDPYYDKLEDVLKYMSDSANDKTISLDIKYPFALFTNSIFSDAAIQISNMVLEYGLMGNVVVESNSVGFLTKVSKQEGEIGTYYICFGNYEKGIANAYQNDLTGISFDYDKSDEIIGPKIELAHELGLRVLLYPINDDKINKVYPSNADIIETDNMNFYDILETQ
jgi:glycerophosphoryl diester phosphodiesterase